MLASEQSISLPLQTLREAFLVSARVRINGGCSMSFGPQEVKMSGTVLFYGECRV